MVRTPCRDKNGLKKGTWSPEEDRRLIAYVTRYGHWNWRLIPKFAGLARCGKSCRLRWMNYLRPGIKRGNFTPQEDDIIIKLHAKLGNRWAKMAAQLPGRSDNEIKNHWHCNLEKRVAQNSMTHESDQVSEAKIDKSPIESEVSDHSAISSSINEVTGAVGGLEVVDFWTEPHNCGVDVSYFPGELLAAFLTEPEILSPVYDAQLWSHY